VTAIAITIGPPRPTKFHIVPEATVALELSLRRSIFGWSPEVILYSHFAIKHSQSTQNIAVKPPDPIIPIVKSFVIFVTFANKPPNLSRNIIAWSQYFELRS
jgi:hypothetical protein